MGIRRLRGLKPPAAVLPSAADLDAVAKEQKVKEATAGKGSPLSTPPAHPSVPEQPSAAGFAPDSVTGLASYLTLPDNVNWSDPKLDTTKKDSLGNEKLDAGTFGPKGANPPADVQTADQRQAAADAKEARLKGHMASTVTVDSLGRQKGRFAVTPQGFNEHGAKIPDLVDYNQVVEALPVYVGPRGKGAPSDTFHGSRPVKK